MIIKRLLGKISTGKRSDIVHNNPSYPVLSADDIYKRLMLHNKLRSIKRKVSIDPGRYEEMYAKPIDRFCEIVQLIPASQSYHHAYPGGLIYHTLSVIEYAINERYKHSLPLASEPEVIEAQKNLWTYMVFAAVLIHDVGKAITMVHYIDSRTNKIVSPISRTLKEQGVKEYHLSFFPSHYFDLHERIGPIFLSRIFDHLSLEFLTHNLDVFKELLGYISKDSQSWGSIGEIVRAADQYSVAEDLRIATATGRKRQFAGAEIENYGERLMRTIRYLVEKRQITINRPGAILFVSDDSQYAYAVSKTIAEKIRETMKELGATDIPSDNSRIFDELQQHGLIESTKTGKAIFNIHVSIPGSGFEQNFTVLKIQYRKIFSVNNQPLKLQGHVTEISTEIMVDEQMTGSGEKALPEKILQQGENDDPLLQQNDPLHEADSTPAAEADANTIISEHAAEDKIENSEPEITEKLSPNEIVDSFYEWLMEQITSKNIIVNRSGKPVYKVDFNGTPCMAVVSPKTFAEYAVSKNLFKTTTGVANLDRESMISAASIVQSAIHKVKANVPCGGKQIHYLYSTSSQSAKARLSFYFFNLEKISNEDLRNFMTGCEFTDVLTFSR